MRVRGAFGKQGNQRFKLSSEESAGAIAVQISKVVCGIGSHLEGTAEKGWLVKAGELEVYGPGEGYYMDADELHDSFPEPGTVTIIDREARDDKALATICWAGGGDWKQEGFTRVATLEEIQEYAGLAALQMAA
jgi:hypothetical protein